jgi:uncharacterized DUF497 family protein
MHYDGIPVEQLPIEAVSWPRPTHLRRSDRYSNSEDIDPADATAAALDPRRVIARDPRSRTGETIRVVGYAPIADRLLVVVLLPADHPPAGQWYGVTARPATRGERRDYYANQEDHDDRRD